MTKACRPRNPSSKTFLQNLHLATETFRQEDITQFVWVIDSSVEPFGKMSALEIVLRKVKRKSRWGGKKAKTTCTDFNEVLLIDTIWLIVRYSITQLIGALGHDWSLIYLYYTCHDLLVQITINPKQETTKGLMPIAIAVEVNKKET